jgi:CMP/dCMP kinase
MDLELYSVTISHQLGSGGAYLGEKLAGRLGIPFLDREILKDVAHQLELAVSEVANREERLSSFWQNFNRVVILSDPAMNLVPQSYEPSDIELFQLECTTIQRIARKSSAVFLGRSGYYVLRDYPRRVSMLVTADQLARIGRLRDLYKLSEADALDLIKTNDQERTNYIRTFTKQNWLDARNYDLCVNTSAVGLDCAVDMAEQCVRTKLKLPAS